LKDQSGRVISLDGGTEVVIEESGWVTLTDYAALSRSNEIPKIRLSPKDALYLGKAFFKYVEDPVN